MSLAVFDFWRESEDPCESYFGYREIAMAEDRGRVRPQVAFLLIGSIGLIFAAAIVAEKQRHWSLHQSIVLGEDYAKEMGGGESSAQKLAALHKMLEKTSLELQGSDRGQSRAIRHEESLVARPPLNAGVEQGASAEWARGGSRLEGQDASSEWAQGGARSRWLVGSATRRHELLAAVEELHDHQRPSVLRAHATPSDTSAVLSQSTTSLARDIRRQRRIAQQRFAGQIGMPASPVAPAPPTEEEPTARASPAAQSRPAAQRLQQAYKQAQALAQAQAQALAQARAQQLSQIWQGDGAVYAPSVMTPYQQQMLESYMGSPTVAVPPAVHTSPAASSQQLQGGSVQLPPPQPDGTELATAWKAYLDPEDMQKNTAAAVQASASAPSMAKKISQLAGVGKAVEHVALDSDGVLQHAESIMSSVKKLLAKPLRDLDSMHKAAPAKSASARQATAKTAGPGTKTADLKNEAEGALEIKLAAAKAMHKKLEEERAHALASEYKDLAKDIHSNLQGSRKAKMSSQSKARTEVLVGLSEHKASGNTTDGLVLNATAYAAKAASSKSKLSSTLVHAADSPSGLVSSARSKGLPVLSSLPALPSDSTVERAQKMQALRMLAVPRGGTLQMMQQGRTVENAAIGAVSARSQANSSYVAPLDGRTAHGGGGDTPLIDVTIRDSKIVGGLHISRNTGERKGVGTESGCGALCELGKLVANIQDGPYPSLIQGHIPPALTSAGTKMVEQDYVISHVGGMPVYAREMVPVVPDKAATSVQAGSGASESSDAANGLEGNLERAIESEGERQGERRERRRERRRDGDERRDRQRGRRDSYDGAHDGNGSDDMQVVLSRGAMDGMTSKLGVDDTVSSAPDSHTIYKAVHYQIPVAEFDTLTGQPAQAPVQRVAMVPRHVYLPDHDLEGI